MTTACAMTRVRGISAASALVIPACNRTPSLISFGVNSPADVQRPVISARNGG
ncbi:hypothetical protein ACQP0C_13275 [Nocardia sp. CA-129566]|uniref:hypothetical protein n=1 Tax=Nocardia sp. CA-129566 TaxID=3239976 RepID=UPI003D997E97